jgi:hypothetical protein
MSQFDSPITQKNLKLWRLPNIESRIPSLWPTYIGERRTTFAKAYGIQVRCYWEHFGEHIENLKHILIFWWEPIGNWSETYWEHIGNQGKMEKKTFPLPHLAHPPKLKRRKGKPPWVHAWAFPLAAWNFSSHKSSSLFLAWANAPCKEQPTYRTCMCVFLCSCAQAPSPLVNPQLHWYEGFLFGPMTSNLKGKKKVKKNYACQKKCSEKKKSLSHMEKQSRK